MPGVEHMSECFEYPLEYPEHPILVLIVPGVGARAPRWEQSEYNQAASGSSRFPSGVLSMPRVSAQSTPSSEYCEHPKCPRDY